jgi:hypothetical protein
LNALTLQLQEKMKNLNQSKNIENALGNNLLKKLPGGQNLLIKAE